MIELSVPGLKDALPAIHVDAIKDFQVCSLFYDYRYQEKMYESISSERILYQQFDSVIRRVIAFFFYKKMSESTPSYNALLNRWQRLWFPKDMDAYDIAVSQHSAVKPNMINLSNVAAIGLLKLYEEFALEESIPILVDEEYNVPVFSDMALYGKLDLVLRKGDQYKVFKWSTEQRRPALGRMTLDFAAMKMAFDHRNEEKKNVSYYFYDLASTKMGATEVFPTQKDCDSLKFWMDQIRGSDTFYPRRGLTAYCKACPFDEPCSKWDGWKNQKQ